MDAGRDVKGKDPGWSGEATELLRPRECKGEVRGEELRVRGWWRWDEGDREEGSIAVIM